MAKGISADAMASTIAGILDEYTQDVSEAIEKTSIDVAKQVVRELKQGGGYKGGKDFNAGWTSKTEKTRLETVTHVYNKKFPGLAHLLEFGHAKRGGGRTTAFNFIAPINDTVADKFAQDFAQNIGG
jgi:hypothetical protein